MKTTGTILGVLVLLVWTVAETTTSRPCAPRFLSARAMVCVCNATYCDTMDPVSIPAVGRFVKYESTSAGGRLERSEGVIQPSTSGSGKYIHDWKDTLKNLTVIDYLGVPSKKEKYGI
uniref:Glucosylceramidase n=1 Tax=Anolis carolinensis TaxID=28377 RepID=A0A803TYL4_ANOCA